MFAARTNQENVIYEQQTAAAAKSLNQGGKGLAPKTPGNKAPKTPFNGRLNNENATFGGGKTGAKGKGSFGDGKVDASAFITPAGPRTRAPLGNKTTNAKAFQTPAPPTQEKPSVKPTSPRLRRAKVKVHQAEDEVQNEGEEREIEYMPPREIPLPDHPDDWPIDRTYPQFEGENLTRGWYSEFARHKSNDDDDEFSEFDERIKQIQQAQEQKVHATLSRPKPKAASPALQKVFKDPLNAKAPATIKSKHAASALSKYSQPTSMPRFAAPTETAKARLPSAVAAKKPQVGISGPGNTRHTAARAASNSTLGYSKGRVVSNVRRPLAGIHKRPDSVKDGDDSEVGLAKGGAKMLDELFDFGSLHVADDEVGSEGEGGVPLADIQLEEDALEHFEL